MNDNIEVILYYIKTAYIFISISVQLYDTHLHELYWF